MSGTLDTDALQYFVILEGTNNIAVQYLAPADATKFWVVNGSGSRYCVPKLLLFNNTVILC